MAFRIAVFATLVSVSSMSSAETPPALWVEHVPQGWKLIGHAQDGGSAVLVIEKDDPSLRIGNKNLGPDELNTNPRRLLFVERRNGKMVAVGSADRFLPSEHRADLPCLVDPLEEGGMDLARGILTIRLNYWLSCGSYGVTRKTFTFRRDKGGYRLIGYDVSSFSRSSGQGQELSINYLTGRQKRTTGKSFLEPEPGEPAAKPKVTWSKVGKSAVFLDSMDMMECEADSGELLSWCGE